MNNNRQQAGVRYALSNEGLVVIAALLSCVFVYWAAYMEIEQYARASGMVIATARTQVIQTANDGVIEALLTREGEKVTKGDVIARLDRSQVEAGYEDSLAKVAALQAAVTRLRSEVLGRPLIFNEEVRRYPTFVGNQLELFERRQSALRADTSSLGAVLGYVREELEMSAPLVKTGDIGKIEVLRLQKQVAEISGQITNRRNKFFQDAQQDLTKAEEDLAAQEQLLADRKSVYERSEIRAPSDGLVRKIHTTTPGARVRPGDIVMEILPTDSELIVEVKLKPIDIAHIRVGLPAAIKLDAYDFAIYGVLDGVVHYVSPDALVENSRYGEEVFYRVHVRILKDAVGQSMRVRANKSIEIQPGMTANVDIKTGQRTVLSYLTKPVSRTISESLGER